MTLQLEVGKTYRARNGEIVKITGRRLGLLPFIGESYLAYAHDGRFNLGECSEHDLIEEITDPFDRVISALNDAERAEAEAMERIRDSLAELRAAVEAAQKAMRGEG